jgi:hypothetical protein
MTYYNMEDGEIDGMISSKEGAYIVLERSRGFARIAEIDTRELMRDKRTVVRDVTEDLVLEGYRSGDISIECASLYINITADEWETERLVRLGDSA